MTETQHSQPIAPHPLLQHEAWHLQPINFSRKQKTKKNPNFIRVENEKQIECKYTSIVMIKTQKNPKQLIGAHWALQEAS